MKRKTILSLSIALVCTAITYTFSTEFSNKNPQLAANIEALTQGELPAEVIADNCNWLPDGNCTVEYKGTTWDNSNMTNKN